MKFNYLNMIWDVKICLAKIKDGKGKDLLFSSKKKFPTKIPPKDVDKPLLTLFLLNNLPACPGNR
jgi:hypothetical protein